MSTGDTKPARVMLWTCPRSLSTAFTRSILELDDVEVFNEEFTAAFFFGPDRTRDRGIYLAPNHSYKWVKQRLEADYPGRAGVFAKDFTYPLVGRYHLIPEGFCHTFLVRSPTKVFASLKPRLESSKISAAMSGTDIRSVMTEGYTYKELRDLYDHVTGLGLPTFVMDADDLLDDPVEMMRQYCRFTALPFKETMVKWEPARCGDLRWHCCRALRLTNWMMQWYEGALKSSGFKKPAPRHIDVESLPQDVRLAIEVSQPHYDHMYARRVILNSKANCD
ncbi:branched-chain-amino-acid aminotransferase-like protein 2 [Acanthaster planci]|uniref:Branched-chain-amino-acid aminotransferase-like protein 2 n=1 Tax=Acanthaster planci TaxID=133434 RepID=A0A8B7ZSC4_ACAPL|nr:branched-chain-amino-acid aminotransferase-like protein 2 [Acanthaster planci]